MLFVKGGIVRQNFAYVLGLVFVFAQISFAEPPPPPKDCNPRDMFVDLPGQSDYRFRTSKTNHDEIYSKSCQEIIVNDGLRYTSGTISTKCDDGKFEDLSQNCQIDQVKTACEVTAVVGVSKSELNEAYKDAGISKEESRTLLREIPEGDMAQSNVIKVITECGSTYTSDGSAAKISNLGKYEVGIPVCSPSYSEGLCYLDPFKGVMNDFEFVTNGASGMLVDSSAQFVKKSAFYIWNKGSTESKTLNSGSVQFNYRHRLASEWRASSSPTLNQIDVPGVPAEATGCELKVSGAVSGYSATTPPQVAVGNDVLVFSVKLTGGSGGGAAPSIEYVGGPNPVTGVWSNPPVGVASTVTANVETTYSKNKFSCKLTVLPQGKSAMVRLRRFGDCSYFNSLRTYYYMDASNKGYQSSAYSQPLSLPGISAKYGTSSAEVPIKGVMNAAAALSGEIVVDSAGKVTLPPLENRAYAKAIVVAKRFQADGTGAKAADPLYYGLLDLNDYSLTQLYKVDPAKEPDSDESVVFQAFLAGTQPDGIRDLRGTADGLPYYRFTPSTNSGKPYDRVIPFMNESCVPLFQANAPKRADKPVPSDLNSVTQCMYSRPFKVSDIKAGRIDLTLLHLVPEHAHHQFPAELFKASAQPACVAKNPSNQKECWDVKSSNFGISANAKPFEAHDSCRTVTTTWVDQSTTSTSSNCVRYGNSYSCSPVSTTVTTKVPVTVVNYKASCPVLEPAGECGKNLALRFSGYNQMMIAGLGCAATYNRAGELVSATLKDNGILPYTSSLGGSDPKPFSQYPDGHGSKKGFACIPCRFANDAIAKGEDFIGSTKALPVDQDATSARKPIFSFNKLKAPSECVRDITFEVRYFGSKECTGVSNPPGHFCSSENLGGQSCAATDGKGGGNVAGKFTIPVCPNSGFEYDNVSVSWSPLIIDAAGNGIEISRDARYALEFDIRAEGKKRLIDWPINTKEVAFLVLPNSKGKVESIRELFGDYKAADGFAALGKYDKNRDQKIDKNDAIFGSLRLWFDQNRNAVAEDEEIVSLEKYGVDTIYLEYRKITNRGTEGRTLSSVYYNSKYREYLNVGDYYFNDYSGVKKKKSK